MLRVALTGGVACGKSTVAKMFAGLGAHVLDADKIVHELYRKDQPVYREILNHFGPEILRSDKEIDRPRLAALVFDGGRVQELNRIVHPAVFLRQREWMLEIASKYPDAVMMVEAALTLEAGGKARYDKIIVVTCAPEQKVARYAQRAGISEAAARTEVERRSRAQMRDDEKAAMADYVIDNSGSLEETRTQAVKIYSELQRQVRSESR
ncbi:MAG TPA: dephospho-CoA kinase [Candidatus Angelobacter sp.]|nr:dephospho-CoA kinase [Candidatus Angelobacter sp.]